MGAGRQMTPEEEEMLRQYILQQQGQTNPFAYAANDWGQGAGILGMEERPDSFSRVNDINDRLSDMTRTTGLDFAEMVPGLNQYVAQPKPGDVTPYQSDSSFLYSGNPVYQSINDLVSGADGGRPMSLDQAIARVQAEYRDNPEEFEGLLPVATSDNFNAGIRAGEPDWNQFRTGATTFLTEGRKEQNSMSEAEALQQQYEDYIRPRSQYEFSGAPTYADVRGQYAEKYGWDDPKLEYQELNPGARPEPAARVPLDLSKATPQATDRYGVPVSSPTRNPMGAARSEQRRGQARADAEAIRNSPNRPLVGGIRGRGENQYMGSSTVKRNDREQLFKEGFDIAMNKAKERQVASKKEENIAKLIAAYNSFHYGQA